MDGNPKIDWHSLTGGSFNYCDPGIKPSSSNGRNNLAGWAEYIWRGIGHALKYYAIDHVKDNPDRENCNTALYNTVFFEFMKNK